MEPMSRSYPPRPLVGVGAVVIRDGRVLLVRRGKPPRLNEWSLPGGAQRLAETVEQAVRREVAEETGFDIACRGVVAVVDFIDRDEAGAVRYHYTLIDFLAEIIGGDPRPGDDARELAWAPLDDLAGYGLWEETVRVIRLATGMICRLDHHPSA